MATSESTPDPHTPVLLDEVVRFLVPDSTRTEWTGIDCTTNGGGHSAALLVATSPFGRMLCLDADPAALRVARARLAPFLSRYVLVNRNFRDLGLLAAEQGLMGADAVLFDLGLSSAQLDLSGRGFSFRFDEPLDMRFGTGGPTAAHLLNDLPEADLERVFREYGEEPRARRVASVVGKRRQSARLERTGDLVAAVIAALGPARGRIHPATRVFQGLRIAVNDELGALEEGLSAAVQVLKPGGRLAVISFHSLEDRIVKWRLRGWADSAAQGAPLVRILTKKPVRPTEAETAQNPRARSAKLRVAERLSPDAAPPPTLSHRKRAS